MCHTPIGSGQDGRGPAARARSVAGGAKFAKFRQIREIFQIIGRQICYYSCYKGHSDDAWAWGRHGGWVVSAFQPLVEASGVQAPLLSSSDGREIELKFATTTDKRKEVGQTDDATLI